MPGFPSSLLCRLLLGLAISAVKFWIGVLFSRALCNIAQDGELLMVNHIHSPRWLFPAMFFTR